MAQERLDPMPVIARVVEDVDEEVPVLQTAYDGVTFTRGYGSAGHRIEVVEHECPASRCDCERLVREWRVNVEAVDRVKYWCTDPTCAYYLGTHLSYAFERQQAALDPVETSTDA